MAISSAGMQTGATQGDPFNRKKTPSPKPGRSGSRSLTPQVEKDTFTPTNAWKQQLVATLQKAHEIEKSWQGLAIDETIGLSICNLLRQSIENYKNLTPLIEQGKELRISEVEYTLDDGQPRTFALPKSSTQVFQGVTMYFQDELRKIEKHQVGSPGFHKAVASFIQDFWD